VSSSGFNIVWKTKCKSVICILHQILLEVQIKNDKYTDNLGTRPFWWLQYRQGALCSNRPYILKYTTHTNFETICTLTCGAHVKCLPLKTVTYKTCNICWHCIWMTKSNIWNKSRPLGVSDYTPKNKNAPFNVTHRDICI